MSDESQKTLIRALYRLLRPMVRLLMRHGVSYRLFSDLVRHVYVDVAREDFALTGRKQSLSRMAVLTGINRKDIAKLDARPHPLSGATEEKPTPAARVITGWLNDVQFHDAQGKPAPLSLEEDPQTPGFASLVRSYTNDVPARALLDELERIGAVTRQSNFVELVTKGYLPVEDRQENIRIFGTAAADLMATMDHNIAKLPPGPYIQRTVSYQHIPLGRLAEIRHRSAQEGQEFLLQVNRWLSEYEQQPSTDMPRAESGARAGIGLYYFEQLEPDDSGSEGEL